MKHDRNEPNESPRAPLWKWLLIIILVLAMPLFFSFYRDAQIEQALMTSEPPSQSNQQ